MPALADEEEPPKDDAGILTLQFNNDMFGNSDRHFTHGTRFSYQSSENAVPDWVVDTAGGFPLFNPEGTLRVTYSLGQDIFTPENIDARSEVRNDRPYAGWLYGGIGLTSENGIQLDNLELNLGIVGPLSYAEEVQTNWHDFIGIPEPRGWDNQLKNEPGVVLYYERKWRAVQKLLVNDLIPIENLGFDLTPHLGTALGNVYTYGAAGLTVRFGDNLPDDYGPPRIRPSLPGSDFFRPSDNIGWYIFAGFEGRFVARNIFLDGNSFRDGPDVDKRLLVGDLQAGVAVTLGGAARIAYTHLIRSKEFDGQDEPDQFGSLSLSLRF